jgi:pimeloyl-ACP methyl ester carboxylesterase
MNRRELLLGFAAAVVVGACAPLMRSQEARMASRGKTFVFVHGSWHGAWCWFKVTPLLERHGHRAVAVDLPGHGRDWRSPKEVTLQDYVDAVVRVLDEQPDPVVLVGHSRGGIVVSQVAEARPEKIARSVYVAAFLLADGQAMLDVAMSDRESLIVPNLIVDEAAGYHMLKREAFRDALYADCSPEDLALAGALLTPEPNAPVGTPLRLTAERYGRVPRVYIEATNDRGISPALQRKMCSAVGVGQVLTLTTSHSPFLSAPGVLVEKLIAAAG